MNYFEFFGFPVAFQVDEVALRRIFYENLKKYHPDYHTLADETQQAEMLEMATLNNKAFATLADSVQRMRYVLEIKGMLQEEDKHSMPQEFLLEVMELNEALMELEFDFDPERFQATARALEDLSQRIYQNIRPIMERYNETTGTQEDLNAVLDYFLKNRYLLRIREKLSKFAPH